MTFASHSTYEAQEEMESPEKRDSQCLEEESDQREMIDG